MANERSNAEVAKAFSELADYLDLLGDNPFKTRAYRTAARALETMHEPIAKIAAEDRLKTIPGFGEAIQAKTKDILATGTTKALEEARAKAPASLLPLLHLPNIGVKTIHEIWQGLNITSLEELKKAAEEGRIRTLPGMGEKTEAKILDSISRYGTYSKRMYLSVARSLASKLAKSLRDRPEVERIMYAGSARRGVETVGDIDLVGSSTDRKATMEAFVNLPSVARVIVKGERSTRALLASGVECDLRLVEPGDFGMLLHHFTGSKEHNIHLRDIAERRGLKINEYGVFRGDEEILTGDDENSIYEALGMPPVPVEMRENRGEIEAALAGELPHLLEKEDIRGDLHAHTTASDGKDSIEKMARFAAEKRHYEYLAITDHSQSLAITNGLSPERLREQIRAIQDAGDKYGIHLLTGSEVEIKPDGSLDYPDELLAELDFVIASVHSRFQQTREEMTARMVKAVRNPNVDMIGHPTGRLINEREPYEVDMEALIEAAAETDTAMEINSSPNRLDLNDVHARMAKDAGVKIFVNTDAHATGYFDLLQFGIVVARRAWLEPKDVMNTRPYNELMDWLRR
ncbi:MAG TPA: DNA polymerase/3'-5' exonuclease PolX [Capsulimonadaceae bacterium]|nr:DNA polymerase/3'-5' exonuclease PolX [Capsulimonadaceae bacterium]